MIQDEQYSPDLQDLLSIIIIGGLTYFLGFLLVTYKNELHNIMIKYNFPFQDAGIIYLTIATLLNITILTIIVPSIIKGKMDTEHTLFNLPWYILPLISITPTFLFWVGMGFIL